MTAKYLSFTGQHEVHAAYKIYLITKDTICNNDGNMIKRDLGKNYLFLFVSAFERSSSVA